MAEEEASEDYKFKPFSFTTRQGDIAAAQPIIPRPRCSHRIVCDEGFMYLFGGFNPFLGFTVDPDWVDSWPLFRELWRYSYATNSWLRVQLGDGIPKKVISSAVVLSGHVLLVFGGTALPHGETCGNSLRVYNVKCGGGMQKIKTTGDHPKKQYGQSLVLHEKFLYTVGGSTRAAYCSDIHRLNLETNKWEEIYTRPVRLHDGPPGRYYQDSITDGKRIYTFGATTASSINAYAFDRINAFNLETKTWEVVKTYGDVTVTSPGTGFPPPRRYHASAPLPAEGEEKKGLIICGGYDGDQAFSDVWKFDLSTLQWTCLKQCVLPRPIYFHSIGISPAGQLFTFGGKVVHGGESFWTSEIYSAWLCIPKLTEICWETIIKKYPNLYAVPRNRLLKLGIPEKFVSQLL